MNAHRVKDLRALRSRDAAPAYHSSTISELLVFSYQLKLFELIG